ncbi:hypothetical protein H0H87_000974, partial [Tephrocybe sp. NHM501043]
MPTTSWDHPACLGVAICPELSHMLTYHAVRSNGLVEPTSGTCSHLKHSGQFISMIFAEITQLSVKLLSLTRTITIDDNGQALKVTKDEGEALAKVTQGFLDLQIGYALVPVAQLFEPEDYAPETVPEVGRHKYNSRIASEVKCLDFYEQNGKGGLLDTKNVGHSLLMIVDRSTIDLKSVTWRTNKLELIRFVDEFQGLTKANATAEQLPRMWELVDGGHRTGSIYWKILKPLFRSIKNVNSNIAALKIKLDKAKPMSAKERELSDKLTELDIHRSHLQTAIDNETWAAKLIDREALEKHPQREGIIALMAGNRGEVRIPETEASVIVKVLDYVNQQSDPNNSIHIDNGLSLLTTTKTQGIKKIRPALCNLPVTRSYARLIHNPVMRGRLEFPSTTLSTCRSVASGYIALWVQYQALFYEVLFSSSPDVKWGDLPGKDSSIESQILALQQFNEREPDDKQIRFDLCNGDFVDAIGTPLKKWRHFDAMHGVLEEDGRTGSLDEGEEKETTAFQSFDKAMDTYLAETEAMIESWIQGRKFDFANDPEATEILDQLINKLKWFSSTAIAASWIPAEGRSPFPHAELMLPITKIMDSHAESLKFCLQAFDGGTLWALRMQGLSASSPNFLTLIENYLAFKNPKFSPFEKTHAINAFFARLYRRRHSSLAEMTLLNEGKPIKFIGSFPKLLTVPDINSEPRLHQIQAVVKILNAIVANKPKEDIDVLYEDEFLVDVSDMLQKVMEKTCVDWKTELASKGSKTNTTNDIRIAARMWLLAALSAYPQLVEEPNETPKESFPADYFGNRIIHGLFVELQTLSGWKRTWFKLARLPAITEEQLVEENNDIAMRIEEASMMNALDQLALHANKTGELLRRDMKRSSIWSCKSTQADGSIAIVIKPSGMKILRALHEATLEELEETCKHAIDPNFTPDQKLSEENKLAIADRLSDWHVQVETQPARAELDAWHSAENMAEVIRSQLDPDPELSRLINQREKRVAKAMLSSIKAEEEPKPKQRKIRRTKKALEKAAEAEKEKEYLLAKDKELEASIEVQAGKVSEPKDVIDVDVVVDQMQIDADIVMKDVSAAAKPSARAQGKKKATLAATQPDLQDNDVLGRESAGEDLEIATMLSSDSLEAYAAALEDAGSQPSEPEEPAALLGGDDSAALGESEAETEASKDQSKASSENLRVSAAPSDLSELPTEYEMDDREPSIGAKLSSRASSIKSTGKRNRNEYSTEEEEEKTPKKQKGASQNIKSKKAGSKSASSTAKTDDK